VVRRIVPHAEESLVWGGLSYHLPQVGGRIKGAVCQIVAKNGQVRLDFIHGIRLADPSGLLQGDRVSKRFVPIGTVADAERPEIAALIREAAALLQSIVQEKASVYVDIANGEVREEDYPWVFPA
jgi:hypothetical protein